MILQIINLMILSYILNGCGEYKDVCRADLIEHQNYHRTVSVKTNSKNRRGGDGISDNIIKIAIESDKIELKKLKKINKKLKLKNENTQLKLNFLTEDQLISEYKIELKNLRKKLEGVDVNSDQVSKSKKKSYILQDSIIKTLYGQSGAYKITKDNLKDTIWKQYRTKIPNSGNYKKRDEPFIILSIINTYKPDKIEKQNTQLKNENTQLKNENTQLKDIVDIATSNKKLSTLVSALKAVGLVDVLKRSEGPFTVFAPTNEAFAALPDGSLDMLFKLENQDRLRDILLYHVLPGKKLISNDFPTGETITLNMANKKDATIYESRGAYIINEANVVITDIEASNGVIHVIDNVMPTPG